MGAVVSVDAVAAVSPGDQRVGLGAHVGEQVHRGLLHGRVASLPLGFLAVQTPRPLHRTGAEHQGPAGSPVQGQVVGGGARGGLAAVVGERLRRGERSSRTCPSARPGGSRCRRPRPTHSRACRLPDRAWSTVPEARLATRVFRQNRSLLYVDGTAMSVVPALTMNNWPVSAFCGFPPSAGGLNRGSRQVPVQVGGSCRIDRRVVVRLLVGDQRPVRRVRAVDAGLQPRLPEHLVAAEEREVDAGVAGRLARSRAAGRTSTRRGRST